MPGTMLRGKAKPKLRGRHPQAELSVVGTDVILRLDQGFMPDLRAVALLLDGRMVAQGNVDWQVKDPAIAFLLPPGTIGGALQAVTMPDGRGLGAPLDVTAVMGVHWLGWSATNYTITGTFRPIFPGRGEAATVAVEIMSVEEVLHVCFAVLGVDGDWAFSCPLPRLPAIDGTLTLTLRVAGFTCDERLVFPQRSLDVVGYLDPSDDAFVQGWAVDLTEPTRRVEVVVEIQGRLLHRGPVEEMRYDIKELGLSDGQSAFRLQFPPDLRRDVPLQITATLAETGTHLFGSPRIVPPVPPIIGYFDSLEGPFAGGWAVNMHWPDTPLRVEAVCNGVVIGEGVANLYRGDVAKAGLPTALCGFRFLLDAPIKTLIGREIDVRVVGSETILPGSPRQINQNSNMARFLARTSNIPASKLQRLSRKMTHETADCLISIIMPVHETSAEWLVEALNSVLTQWSGNWELIVIDDGSTSAHVHEILSVAGRHDQRVRVLRLPENVGIARATNYGLRAARGDYVSFLDHDDTIEPDAVHKLAKAALQTSADLIYSDEAITTEDIGSIVEVRARPAFSYDYYLSHPYFVHMIAVRTELAHRVSGWDERLPISADVDFVLRVIEQSKVITHVPSVLYRWRTHLESTGHSKRELVTSTMLDVLNGHLQRQRLPATARSGLRFNEYRVDWEDDGGEVLIIIPTKDRTDLLKTAIESIEATAGDTAYRIVVIDHMSTEKKSRRYLASISSRHTVMPYSGPFNYAAMNNAAVDLHSGSAGYFLFLNNDVEAKEQGWLGRMRSLAARPDVGAVGCMLLYGDNRVQHGGVLVAFSGAADHAMKFQEGYLGTGERHPGYNCSLTSVRDYSAVTAACMIVKRSVFEAVGGFDERFAIGFNDTDLCLRIRASHHKVLYDGQTVLYHHESATRMASDKVYHPEDDALLRTRWAEFFREGDPFYSPLLEPRGTDHSLRQDPGCKGKMAPRSVHIGTSRPAKAAKRAPRAVRRKSVAVVDD